VKPETPTENIITAYGDGGFRVSGIRHEGSLIVLPDRIIPWRAASLDDLERETFDVLAGTFEVLLIGCGAHMLISAKTAREALSGLALSVDVMDTGAACRTYNVLVTEGRPVAAALIAVD
jgi:uncharacterized protein